MSVHPKKVCDTGALKFGDNTNKSEDEGACGGLRVEPSDRMLIVTQQKTHITWLRRSVVLLFDSAWLVCLFTPWIGLSLITKDNELLGMLRLRVINADSVFKIS